MGPHDYLRFILSLAFVLALMGLANYALRRYGPGGGAVPGRKRRLAVLETRPLDHRHKLVLVSCDGREHLLLLGPSGQTLVDTLPPVQSAAKEAS